MIGYSEDYFYWQKQLGFLGGKYDTIKYLKYIKGNDKILDFGCGGGFSIFRLFCYINSYLHRDRKEVMTVVRRTSE